MSSSGSDRDNDPAVAASRTEKIGPTRFDLTDFHHQIEELKSIVAIAGTQRIDKTLQQQVISRIEDLSRYVSRMGIEAVQLLGHAVMFLERSGADNEIKALEDLSSALESRRENQSGLRIRGRQQSGSPGTQPGDNESASKGQRPRSTPKNTRMIVETILPDGSRGITHVISITPPWIASRPKVTGSSLIHPDRLFEVDQESELDPSQTRGRNARPQVPPQRDDEDDEAEIAEAERRYAAFLREFENETESIDDVLDREFEESMARRYGGRPPEIG
jgi:hypothetical protein